MANLLRLRVKRIYEPPSHQDGLRFLVDRLWPRGLKKEVCELDGRLKEVAPSNKLRSWLRHGPSRWNEFRRRYFEELDGQPETCEGIAKLAREETVTLLFAARDTEHNHALALESYLQSNHRFARNR